MAIPTPGYWYVDSVAYTAVTAWATGAVKAAGAMVRQNAAPSVGNERVFVCVVAGTTHASTEPTWTVTKGAKTTDNTVTWQECTGQAALNGSLTYTSGWTSGPGGSGTGVKNQAVALGYIIARDNGASYQICTTAGTAGNGAEPSFSNTAGTTTSDNTVTWTSLGVVGNFTTAFGAPHARLVNAFATNWGAAGDIFWVGDNHAETQSTSMTMTCPGTVGSFCYVYCVDHTKTSPGTGDLLTAATITTTGASSMSFDNYCYIYGITFSASSSSNSQGHIIGNNTATSVIYEACNIKKAGTSASNTAILFGGSTATANNALLINTTLTFGATGDGIKVGDFQFTWKNTASAIAGATIPTTLFTGTTTPQARVTLQGVDLSALGSGKTIFAAMAASGNYTMIDCKLGASVTVAATPTNDGAYVDLICCDSGTVTSHQERYQYQGTQTLETTIVRTSGASDGTTPMSWKVVSTANSTWVRPFQCFPIGIWNATTGSTVTCTVEIVNDGTTFNNDDVWMEVQYLGSSSTPQASFKNCTKANNLATPSAITTSTATWTTTGLGSPIKQKLVVTLSSPSPGLAGYLYGAVYVGKASATLYIDPLITLG